MSILSNDGAPRIVPGPGTGASYPHRMQLWSDFVSWLTDSQNEPVLYAVGVLFVGIVVSGLIAAWIARGTVRGILVRTDRQQKSSAIAALVDAATEASVWNSLTPAEQVLSDRAVGQADILVRLLPVKGAGLAANWAGHQLAELKRNSATFGYQLDPAVAEFRDRLIEWQNKPGRAKRIFSSDLERWRFEAGTPAGQLEAEQDKWVAQQHHEKYVAEEPTMAMPELPKAPQYLHADRPDDAQPERYTA